MTVGSARPQLPVAVVGAGAAGLMAAIFAARASAARVIVLERTRDGGRKILVSGGGRCNVLPAVAAPERFVTSSSPNTLRKLLLAWPLAEQRAFFEDDLRVPLALEADSGKLFPLSNRARDIRDGLVALAERAGVEVRRNAHVVELAAAHALDEPPAIAASPGRKGSAAVPIDRAVWRIGLADGTRLEAAAVVMATGGLSLPASGSDGGGLVLLQKLGHTVQDTYAALTPLTLEPPRFAHLAGLSLDVTLRASMARREQAAHGGFLFTHRGYSGPVVLDLSHLAVRARLAALQASGATQATAGEPGASLRGLFVQWSELDALAWEAELRGSSSTVLATLRRRLPDRLVTMLIDHAAVPADRLLAYLRRDERQRLVAALARFPLPWSGDEGYAKAEVTGGGVALDEVAPASLESRLHPGLFLCGELLDAFGPIGGHNFQWAWATGRAAGIAAGRHAGRAEAAT
jgi:predicted Rossmann fold flavoprotein